MNEDDGGDPEERGKEEGIEFLFGCVGCIDSHTSLVPTYLT